MNLKNYSNNHMILERLKEAINIFAEGEKFHNKMMLFTHSMGLQGHKRLNRHESSEDRDKYIHLQNYVIDMFGEVIEPKYNYNIETPINLKDYLEKYLAWENTVYKHLSSISNDLITEAYNFESKEISDNIKCVRKEIERVRRMLIDYELVNYDMSYIRIKDHELHEKMKNIE